MAPSLLTIWRLAMKWFEKLQKSSINSTNIPPSWAIFETGMLRRQSRVALGIENYRASPPESGARCVRSYEKISFKGHSPPRLESKSSITIHATLVGLIHPKRVRYYVDQHPIPKMNTSIDSLQSESRP